MPQEQENVNIKYVIPRSTYQTHKRRVYSRTLRHDGIFCNTKKQRYYLLNNITSHQKPFNLSIMQRFDLPTKRLKNNYCTYKCIDASELKLIYTLRQMRFELKTITLDNLSSTLQWPV